jgi:hypothetical protein
MMTSATNVTAMATAKLSVHWSLFDKWSPLYQSTFLRPFRNVAMLMMSTSRKMNNGRQRSTAARGSVLLKTTILMSQNNPNAISPPKSGANNQLWKISLTVSQLTDSVARSQPSVVPAAKMPAPMTPPTMLCVVDTGMPHQVASVSQMAVPRSAASMP